jgi:membrane-bound lytic murein transglycosylase B
MYIQEPIKNTANRSTRITKTPTHYKTHTYKPTHYKTHTHTHTHTHTTKQVKTTTVQDIHKRKSQYTQVPSVMGTAVAQWLRYCAKKQKLAGSISDGAMEFFIDINPSDRTMALGSTQPLTEMSTRSISWG